MPSPKAKITFFGFCPAGKASSDSPAAKAGTMWTREGTALTVRALDSTRFPTESVGWAMANPAPAQKTTTRKQMGRMTRTEELIFIWPYSSTVGKLLPVQNLYMICFAALTALLASPVAANVAVRNDPDRAIYDIPVASPGRGETVLKLVLGSPTAKLATGRSISAFSVHLKSTKGWLAYQHPVAAAENGQTIYLALDAFTPDGNMAGLGNVTAVRVSAWG